MANFFGHGLTRVAKSALTKNSPLYVQYYVTSRCNLRCEQCNVIYANADQEEATLDQAYAIADNLADIGTSIVLLTGGEPFVRKDLVQIAKRFHENGIHVRLQTNGIAKEYQIAELMEAGINDISISLDSLKPDLQDVVNGGLTRFDRGGLKGSWERAINTISVVNKYISDDGFASFGCVLAPRNLKHIEPIIKFATKIGWWVSLVPAHSTSRHSPRSFSSFDDGISFSRENFDEVSIVLNRAIELKKNGYNLYDSIEYIRNIEQFIRGTPVDWRRRNGGVCDSPNLYFAIQPNGDMAVCCDYRLPYSIKTYNSNFSSIYKNNVLRQDVKSVASTCSGCMYGSYPEITISARYYDAFFERAKTFLLKPQNSKSKGINRLSPKSLKELAIEYSY